MALNLSGRSVLTLLDFTSEEIEYMLDLSKNFKDMKRAGYPHRFLEGKNIVLLFEKTSTRTRCAFEVGGMDLGMGVTYLDPGSSQMGKKESIEDTARVLAHIERSLGTQAKFAIDRYALAGTNLSVHNLGRLARRGQAPKDLRAQSQAVAIAILKGVHLFFNHVGDFTNRTFE